MSPSLIWENDANCSTASTIQPPPIIVSGAALTRIRACNPSLKATLKNCPALRFFTYSFYSLAFVFHRTHPSFFLKFLYELSAAHVHRIFSSLPFLFLILFLPFFHLICQMFFLCLFDFFPSLVKVISKVFFQRIETKISRCVALRLTYILTGGINVKRYIACIHHASPVPANAARYIHFFHVISIMLRVL